MTKRGYPIGVIDHLHEVELGAILAIDKVCKENDLEYFLDSGTTLGAARHGGFIPWDDDVDVGMPIDDYRRFVEVASDSLPEGFSIHTATNTKGQSALWAKIHVNGTRFIDRDTFEANCEQGIYIDVFPYCSLPTDDARANHLVRRATWLQRTSCLCHITHPKVPRSTPLRPLAQAGCVAAHAVASRTISTDWIVKEFDEVLSTPGAGKRWYDPCYGSFVFDKEDLFPTVTMSFEGHDLPVPADCDAYLKVLYGDWHQLPPEEDRYTHTPLILDFGDGVNVMEGEGA